jgi:hypothetical protein
MPSAVDICNIALSHVGAEGLVTSISPPDGSVEAGLCATFYPIARRSAIEMVVPSCAVKRVDLAEVANTSGVWLYAYAKPSDCIKPLRILNTTTLEALLIGSDSTTDALLTDERGSADFTVEGDVVRTNEPGAVCVYLFDQTDTSKFTSLFAAGVGMLLAGYLAGPIIKGRESVGIGTNWTQAGRNALMQAAVSDANASSERNEVLPSSIRARG